MDKRLIDTEQYSRRENLNQWYSGVGQARCIGKESASNPGINWPLDKLV